MSSNPPAVGDEESFVVRRTIHINATTEKVWQAITEPEHISRWFARAEVDAGGTRGTMTFAGDDHSIPFAVARQDPGRSVTYRWNNDDAGPVPVEAYHPASATEFTFTIDPAPDGTTLTVEESGFEVTSDPVANLRSHTEGWTRELDKLVALLENAAAGPE